MIEGQHTGEPLDDPLHLHEVVVIHACACVCSYAHNMNNCSDAP
jgi:hypothetical protein